MYFLRSCTVIYDDFTTSRIEECDGLTSLFTMTNLTASDIIILILLGMLILYFLLKTISLFTNKE